MAAPNPQAALDQLQAEVNRVLEQTGRVFQAVNNNSRAVPTAQISKLKQILPGSINRFHGALDQLEDELQTAKLVMRRDLAICRERVGLPTAKPHISEMDITIAEEPDVVAEDAQAAPESKVASEDVMMEDSQPAPDAVETTEKPASTDIKTKRESEEVQEPKGDSKPIAMDPKPEDGENGTNENATETQALQIDTAAKPEESKVDDNGETKADDDKPPDTGTFSNTNDLDSLFGGPLSAGITDAPEFAIDPNNNDTDFDFGTFDTNNGDNDNISSLLPGLQDYANNQPSGGDTDFDALFSTDLPAATDDGQEVNTQHRDSTFDDLLDFADFDAGDYAAGTGQDGSNENQDFDFSFD